MEHAYHLARLHSVVLESELKTETEYVRARVTAPVAKRRIGPT
jgi:hypothetical protein